MSKQTLTGAQILWECLVREGVNVVFGYPGGAILPAYDAMLDYPIRHILVRHEQGATHMADGYARATGKVGVAIATSGPGRDQHGDRHRDRDDGLVADRLHHRSGGQRPDRVRRLSGDRHHRHHAADHEAQLPGDATPAKWRRRFARRLRSRRAAGLVPVLIDITKDAQLGVCEFDWDEAAPDLEALARPGHSSGVDPLALINAAQRPLILAGHGIILGGGEVGAAGVRREDADSGRDDAARHRRLPGVASAEPRHDGHARRGLGEHRHSGIRSADRPRHAVRRSRDRQPEDLRARRQEDSRRHRSGGVQQEREGRCRDFRRRRVRLSAAGCRVSPMSIARSGSRTSPISRAIPRSATFRICPTTAICTRRTSSTTSGASPKARPIVVTDVGQHQMWEAQYYHHETPRSLITSGGLGTMGFALPAAIGAKVGRPDAEVWVVVGDGGFQMTLCELATMVQEELDVKIAIINNGYLGMVRQWQEFFYQRRYAATPITGPDFEKLAEAYGIWGATVTSAQPGGAMR